MAVTGFIMAILAYGGIGGADNLSRTISGLLIGTPIPFVAVPLLNHIMFSGRNSRVPFEAIRDWALLLYVFAIGASLILLATNSIILFVAVSVLGIIGIVVLMFTIILLLVAVLTDGKGFSVRRRLVVAAVSCIVLLVVLAVVHDTFFPQI
jgi:hypothetical protein